MRPDWIRAAGLAISVIALLALFILIHQSSFPAFEYAVEERNLTRTDELMFRGVSSFMWEERGMDLLAQAIVLLASAVGCLALLRREGTGEGSL